MFLVKRIHYFLFYLFITLNSLAYYITALPLSSNAQLATVMKKYSSYIDNYQISAQTQKHLDNAEQYIDRYTNDEFLDHLLNAEEYRQKAQLNFNNTSLYQFNIPLGAQTIPVALCNSDIGKIFFVFTDWSLEWCLYRRILRLWITIATDHIRGHSKEYLNALMDVRKDLESGNVQALEKAVIRIHNLMYSLKCKEVVAHMIHNMLPTIGTYLLLSHFLETLKQYFLLDHSSAQNIFMLLVASVFGTKHRDDQRPVALFDLIEGNWMSGIPLTIIKTGILDQINNVLKRVGMLPDWSSGMPYLFIRRVAFLFFFMRWTVTSFLQPKLFEIIIQDYEMLICGLEEPVEKNETQQKTLQQDFFAKELQAGYQSTFALWLSCKSEKYSSWQTMTNLIIMVPAVVTLAQKLYTLIHYYNTQASTDIKSSVAADKDGEK
jgi:hypothetical protein